MTVFARPEVRWRRHNGPPRPGEPCTCQAWGSNSIGATFLALLIGLPRQDFAVLDRIHELFADDR